MKRFKGKTIINYKANIESQQAFNFTQEKMLLSHIQYLVICNIPSTPTLVINFAKKINKS